MAKQDTVYSLMGMKTPQQIMQEDFAQQMKYMGKQKTGYQQFGAGLGMLLGKIFGGKSDELRQSEEREQAYTTVEEQLATKEQNAAQREAEAFIDPLTPETFEIAARAERKQQMPTDPFAQEIEILNQKAEQVNLLADQFAALGQPSEYIEGLKNQALQLRMSAFTKQREGLKFTRDTEKYNLDMAKTAEELEKLQNRDKFSPQQLAEIQLKSTPESYQNWRRGKGTLVPTVKNSKTPAAIQEYEYFANLPDDDARAQYLSVQSASNWKDTGDSWSMIVNGRVLQSIPKKLKPEDQPETVAKTEKAKVLGKSTAEAQIAQPGQLMQLEAFRTQVSDLMAHPGAKRIFGYLGSSWASVEGTEPFGAAASLEQVQGSTFLQQIPQMKNLGALSDAEGSKITVSANRLKLGLPYEDAQKEAQIIFGLIDRARERIETGNLLSVGDSAPVTVPDGTQRTANGVTYTILP
tara:strand:+ start:1149 stop:2543 length:1395 start_codon:yes stop_codon:yes gene_type:complete